VYGRRLLCVSSMVLQKPVVDLYMCIAVTYEIHFKQSNYKEIQMHTFLGGDSREYVALKEDITAFSQFFCNNLDIWRSNMSPLPSLLLLRDIELSLCFKFQRLYSREWQVQVLQNITSHFLNIFSLLPSALLHISKRHKHTHTYSQLVP